MKHFVAFLMLVILLTVCSSVVAQDTAPKELDAYLNNGDTSYAWKLLETQDVEGAKTFLVELTSQTWHDIVWKHSLYIVQPNDMVESDYAILFITGGSGGKVIGEGDRTLAKQLAVGSGMTVAMLTQVPNQPLFGDHHEDSLIGETFLKAIESKDWSWPLLFPMCKSAIRAMDAVQEVLKKEEKRDIEGFVVTGASKRGWTTWLTGASQDKRVIAIAPIVINTLNMKAQMPYQVETWGEYSDQIIDYSSRNLIQEEEDAQRMKLKNGIFEMVDPYSYRSRLKQPKLIVNGANDPYWTVDAMKFYWDDLADPKYTITLPNAGHGLDDQKMKALMTIGLFARFAALGEDWPSLSWDRKVLDDKYEVSVFTEIPVKAAKLWTATSETKDLRKSKWTSKPIAWRDGYCRVLIPQPEKGHIAYYVELELDAPIDINGSLTTQVWLDGQ
ncbi:MAG: PhoPQ-activated pathogenicity-related family protein [Thermoguttaceae bacterium]